MSAINIVLSPISAQEMLNVEGQFEDALAAYSEDYPDSDDELGEVGATGFLPTLEEVEAAYAELGLTLEPKIIERLEQCRSRFIFEFPMGVDEVDGIRLSALRFVLERAGEALVLLNDYPFLQSEELLAKLGDRVGAEGFGAPPPKKKKKKTSLRDERAGEVRAARIVALLDKAMRRPDVAVDVRRALERVGKTAQTYAALLMEEGAMNDAKAAAALKLEVEELTAAADELDKSLRTY